MKKTLMIVIAIVLVVALSVAGTVAWMTSKDSVSNTFTVGSVAITLDEAKVGTDGKAITGEGATRVDANGYHLTAGGSYDKDPTIHVGEKSDDAYIVAKVTLTIDGNWSATKLWNDTYKMVELQTVVSGGITTTGTYAANWQGTDLTGHVVSADTPEECLLTQDISEDGTICTITYYFKNTFKANADITLFNNLTVPKTWKNDDLSALAGLKIDIVAYAVQAAGFTNVYEAYTAGFSA